MPYSRAAFPFWDEPVSAFGSVSITTYFRGSLELALPLFPGPLLRGARGSGFSSRIGLPLPAGPVPGASRAGSNRQVVTNHCVRVGNSWWNSWSHQVRSTSL